jgi:hypothetical protein
MFRLFPATNDREVGGWPTPYRLTGVGVELCNFLYTVTDPIVGKLAPGRVIPPGTAEGGGFGLSVSELGEGDGMIVYWRERRAGSVFVRNGARYLRHDFCGTVKDFKEAARDTLGRPIEILIGDEPNENTKPLRSLIDQDGHERIGLRSGTKGIDFVWLRNTDHPFRASRMLEADELWPEKSGKGRSNRSRPSKPKKPHSR